MANENLLLQFDLGDTTCEIKSRNIVQQSWWEAQEESREWNEKRGEICEAMWTNYAMNGN